MSLIGVAVTFCSAVLCAVLGELISEEIRARLDRIPLALLAAAARRLPASQRDELYENSWLPELQHILSGDEAVPITRLIHGTRYATGLWLAAPRVSRELDPEAARRSLARKARDAWTAFWEQPSGTYGDLLATWCIATSFVYALAAFHDREGRAIALLTWFAAFMGVLISRNIIGKRHENGPPYHASWPEIVICRRLLSPALGVSVGIVAIMDICTLAGGHGSVGTWVGLIYGVWFGHYPWTGLRWEMKAHARYCSAAQGDRADGGPAQHLATNCPERGRRRQ